MGFSVNGDVSVVRSCERFFVNYLMSEFVIAAFF